MTLQDVLTGLNKSTDIESRIIIDINGKTEDMLFGLCHWDNEKQMLESLDGDDYSLNMQVLGFRAVKGEPLVVWEDASVVNF